VLLAEEYFMGKYVN